MLVNLTGWCHVSHTCSFFPLPLPWPDVAPHSSLHLEVKAKDWNGTLSENVTFYVYMRIGRAPTIDIFDFNCTLPHRYEPWERVNRSADEFPDPDTCFLSNALLDRYDEN